MEAVLLSTRKASVFPEAVDKGLEAVLRSTLASKAYAKKNEKG